MSRHCGNQNSGLITCRGAFLGPDPCENPKNIGRATITVKPLRSCDNQKSLGLLLDHGRARRRKTRERSRRAEGGERTGRWSERPQGPGARNDAMRSLAAWLTLSKQLTSFAPFPDSRHASDQHHQLGASQNKRFCFVSDMKRA